MIIVMKTKIEEQEFWAFFKSYNFENKYELEFLRNSSLLPRGKFFLHMRAHQPRTELENHRFPPTPGFLWCRWLGRVQLTLNESALQVSHLAYPCFKSSISHPNSMKQWYSLNTRLWIITNSRSLYDQTACEWILVRRSQKKKTKKENSVVSWWFFLCLMFKFVKWTLN